MFASVVSANGNISPAGDAAAQLYGPDLVRRARQLDHSLAGRRPRMTHTTTAASWAVAQPAVTTTVPGGMDLARIGPRRRPAAR